MLHQVRWELLRDPQGKSWLFNSERTLSSRYIISSVFRRFSPPPASPKDLKVTIVVAGPNNLEKWKPRGRV